MEKVVRFASSALRAMTVEPVLLMDGACKEAMLLYTENVQMNKICTVKMGYSSEVSCTNLTHPSSNFTELLLMTADIIFHIY